DERDAAVHRVWLAGHATSTGQAADGGGLGLLHVWPALRRAPLRVRRGVGGGLGHGAERMIPSLLVAHASRAGLELIVVQQTVSPGVEAVVGRRDARVVLGLHVADVGGDRSPAVEVLAVRLLDAGGGVLSDHP